MVSNAGGLLTIDNVTTGFNYVANPGNVNAFPWLSAIALRFDQFRFKSLKYIVESNSSTSNSGWVIAAVDYNPNDTMPIVPSQLY